VLDVLFENVKDKSDIPRLLKTFEEVRTPRTNYIKGKCADMVKVYNLRDGKEQELRDHQLLHEAPFSGYPNYLSDPVLQKVLFDWDARESLKGALAQHA
jgi:salicylate hydroxylase